MNNSFLPRQLNVFRVCRRKQEEYDRLMHRCTMLEFEGKSCRLKEAAARLAIHPETS